jgi:hypothetical protein
MASEVDNVLKEVKAKPSGVATLIKLATDDLRTQKDSNNYQANMLSTLVDSNSELKNTTRGLDLGVGKIIKIIQEAQQTSLPPPIPSDNRINDGIQYQLEYLNLIDTRIEEGNGLMRGVLSHVTRIRTIMDDMLEMQKAKSDKKTFSGLGDRKNDGPKVKLKESEGGILETLFALGAWALAPLTKWLWPWLKEKSAKFTKTFKEKIGSIFTRVKSWFDDILLRAKSLFDDAIKMFAKKFPKITGFLKGVGGFFKKIMASGFAKWVGKGAGLMGKLATQIFGGLFGLVGKLLGKAILPIMAIYDFFMGWFNADTITGKTKDALSIWDKAAAGIASILSGLTFGFVKASDFYEVIFGDYGLVDMVAGLFKDLWSALPDGFKSVATSIWGTIKGLTDVLMVQVNGIFGDNITSRIEKLFDDISKWMDEKLSWDNLKPSWLKSEGEDEKSIDKKNAAFTKVQNAKAIPMVLDTSSKAHSDKKAFMESKKAMGPVVVQAPPVSIVNQTGGFTPNVFEADMFMQLIGK